VNNFVLERKEGARKSQLEGGTAAAGPSNSALAPTGGAAGVAGRAAGSVLTDRSVLRWKNL